MNIIGLGYTGCVISANIYERNSDVYKLFLIDVEKFGKYKTRKVETQENPEGYEENYRSLKRYFSKLEEDTILVLSGQDMITSCILRLLQELEEKTQISILYIKPDSSMLSYKARIHERMVRGVLQQYARSNKIERIYLTSIVDLEKVTDPAPMTKYYEHIYDTISYTFHMLNYYQNTTPVYTNISKIAPTAKISAFGIFDVATKKEKMFFDLDMPRKIMYYYGVVKKVLDEDHDLFGSVKKHIRSIDAESVECAIYELTGDTNFGIVLKSSTLIQELEFESPN